MAASVTGTFEATMLLMDTRTALGTFFSSENSTSSPTRL
jgi:hypothetical protein